MTGFGSIYSSLYDKFYGDKDYTAECVFLQDIFHRFSNSPVQNILDLGCGTGGHSILLAKVGFSVSGVDLSHEMLEIAKQKAKNGNVVINYQIGDMRTVQLGRKFDAVISMFAVLSYQITNKDVLSSFLTARKHLNRDGLFIFDVWYGPAVYSQKPETRVKEFTHGGDRIIRIAIPELNSFGNFVNVFYDILRTRGQELVEEVTEVHSMRYFFSPEIEQFAQTSDFEVIAVCPFLKPGEVPTEAHWNVTWVLKAI